MDSEEFNKVCKRLNAMLTTRVEKAWEKKQRRPTKKSDENHIEASKEAFAFIHLLDLVEHMSAEIHDLRMEMATVGSFDDDDVFSPVGEPPRKKYLN